jgi:hypothetical protein
MRLVLELWDELRTNGTPITSVARGESMWPAVPDGSWLTVTPCEATHLQRDELVVFRRHGAIVSHRVVDLRSDGTVLAWGDSLLTPDAPIDPKDVFGRAVVCKKSPVLGRAFQRGIAFRWSLACLRRAAWRYRSAKVAGR